MTRNEVVVLDQMHAQKWYTLQELEALTGYPKLILSEVLQGLQREQMVRQRGQSYQVDQRGAVTKRVVLRRLNDRERTRERLSSGALKRRSSA